MKPQNVLEHTERRPPDDILSQLGDNATAVSNESPNPLIPLNDPGIDTDHLKTLCFTDRPKCQRQLAQLLKEKKHIPILLTEDVLQSIEDTCSNINDNTKRDTCLVQRKAEAMANALDPRPPWGWIVAISVVVLLIILALVYFYCSEIKKSNRKRGGATSARSRTSKRKSRCKSNRSSRCRRRKSIKKSGKSSKKSKRKSRILKSRRSKRSSRKTRTTLRPRSKSRRSSRKSRKSRKR